MLRFCVFQLFLNVCRCVCRPSALTAEDSQQTMMQADDAPTAPPIPLVANAPPTNNSIPARLLPYPLFDAVLDLSHPGASSPSSTQVIYPPANVGSGIVDLFPADHLTAEFGPETAADGNESCQQSQGVAKIARFAYPEYNDVTNASEVAHRTALLQRTGGEATSPKYNRHDLYLEQVFTAAENSAVPLLPSHHVFSHRLSNGTVIHGHVRRYLSQRSETSRSDVGRRSIRALVILTRNTGGGGRLYTSMLKTLEVLKYKPGESDAPWFLQSIFQEHVNLCRDVGAAISSTRNEASPLLKPRIITLPLIEAGRCHGLFGSVDSIKFACPPSFLHEREPFHDAGYSRNNMMPMLRCLGLNRSIRLLSALLSEKRIILTSTNATKLTAVSYGAVSMMGQGMLSPPPVFVPILPPGLASLLFTPSAYMIGVLKGATANFIDLRSMVPNLNELVIFDLDSTGNEPYFVGVASPNVAVPDLTRRSFEDVGEASLNGMSLPDMLYQDLSEVIKYDKKQMFWQGAVQEKLGMAAEKGKTAAKMAVKKGLKYLKDKKRSIDGKDVKEDKMEEEDASEKSDNGNSLTKFVGKGNFFYEQGFPNEAAEIEARVAFTTFFVCLFGDLRVYLSQSTPGLPPVADRDKFMKYRANNGDFPGSSMYNLLSNFLRSSLFDQFVNCRLQELQSRRPLLEDAPLFALTTNYHRSNKIEFAANNIRQSVRQIAMNPNLPEKYLTSWNERIRRRVLDLTSTQSFQGDARRALSLLTEDCHETTSILVHTMMILWTRIQEGKGMQWKKALLALHIFRDLLLNGPINAVAEAIDGFASIRILKSYSEAMRGQNSALVRAAATEVYNLTVNLPVLFAMRRECLNSQRLVKDPTPSPFRKETRMIRGISQFRNVHIALRPAGATVAAVTPAVNDLLGQEAPSINSLPPPQTTNYSSDLLSLGVEAPSNENQQLPNPFDMAVMNQNMPTANGVVNVVPMNTSARQISQQQMPPATSNVSSTNSNQSSQSQQNQVTLRASPPLLTQPIQQRIPQHQTQSAPALFPQVIPGSVPPMQQQMQHQQNQGILQQPGQPIQIPSQQQTQRFDYQQSPPVQQPYMQQPQQQGGNAIQQHGPQGFGTGMPHQGGSQYQHGFHQPPSLPQQQPNKPNVSMFDPMAK